MVAEKHRKESISDNWKELGRISLIVLSELSLCVLARLLLKKSRYVLHIVPVRKTGKIRTKEE